MLNFTCQIQVIQTKSKTLYKIIFFKILEKKNGSNQNTGNRVYEKKIGQLKFESEQSVVSSRQKVYANRFFGNYCTN